MTTLGKSFMRRCVVVAAQQSRNVFTAGRFHLYEKKYQRIPFCSKRYLFHAAISNLAAHSGKAGLVAVATGGAGVLAALSYAGYDVDEFRRMIGLHKPNGQVRFRNVQDYIHLVNEVKARTPTAQLDKPTMQRCVRVAEILADFDEKFVGMERVKEFLLEQAVTGLLQLNLKADGTPSESMNHFTIVGPAGVGKTTLALSIAPLYHAIGLTGEDKITILQAKDLIAGFVGGTSALASEALEKAKNGFVFIDEAHLLKNGYWKDFLQVFLQWLTANPLTVCVLAGYQAPIRELKKSDPGLDRRFQNEIELTGYQPQELAKIFTNMITKDGFVLHETVTRQLVNYFTKNTNLFPQFAGDVQALTMACKTSHGLNTTHFPTNQLREITLKDFEDGSKKYATSKTPQKWW